MSNLVPEVPFEGTVKVVKLMNGEELLGIVPDVSDSFIYLIMPAKVELAYAKNDIGLLIEYVKLTNYAASIQNNEISLNKSAIMYIGDPTEDMIRMYQQFYIAMKNNPDSVKASTNEPNVPGNQAGLEMLNELFNNPDFVNFVNDLIDTFEGVEMEDTAFEDIEEESEETITELLLPETPAEEPESETTPKPSKRKKRSRMKPETNGMPFNPEGNPNSAESWSDNPEDYI